ALPISYVCQGLLFFILEIGKILVLLSADTTGMGRSRWRAGSYQVTRSAGRRGVPGQPADRLKASNGCGSRYEGQAAPGSCGGLTVGGGNGGGDQGDGAGVE